MMTAMTTTTRTEHPYQIVLHSSPPTTSPLWWEFCRSHVTVSGSFGGHLGQASYLIGREVDAAGSAVLGSWPTEAECALAKEWLGGRLPELRCTVRFVETKGADEKDATNTNTNDNSKNAAVSEEASDEIARLYREGLISPREYRHIVEAHRKFEEEAQDAQPPLSQPPPSPTVPPRRLPDVYDAYAHRLNPTFWANHRLYAANVPALPSMCLVEFARKYAVPRQGRHAGRIKYHRNGVITRKLVFHPQYSSDPNFEGGRDYGRYCRFALVRYRPWIDAPFGRRRTMNTDDAGCGTKLEECKPKEEDCIMQWKDHLLGLRERMHLIPDVLLPEELKGGGASIELLVVPFVERAEEPEEVVEGEVGRNGSTTTTTLTANDDEEENMGDDDEEDEMDETSSICLSSVMGGEADESSTSNVQASDLDESRVRQQAAATTEIAPSSPQDAPTNEIDQASVTDYLDVHHNTSSQVDEFGGSDHAIEEENANDDDDDEDDRPLDQEPIQPTSTESPRALDEELNWSLMNEEALESAKKTLIDAEPSDPTLSVSYAFETDDQATTSPEINNRHLPVVHRTSSWTVTNLDHETYGAAHQEEEEVKSTPAVEEVDTETASSSSSDDGSFVQSSWDEASFGAQSAAARSCNSAQSALSSDPSPAAADAWNVDFDQEVNWGVFGATTTADDEPISDAVDTSDAWDTSKSLSLFATATPSSPTRKLAPSRRDLTSSPCRTSNKSPCRTSNKLSTEALLARADAIIEKADEVEKAYHGDVSQVYKKLQDAQAARPDTPEIKMEHPHELFDFIEQAGDGIFGPAAFFASHPKSTNEQAHLLRASKRPASTVQ